MQALSLRRCVLSRVPVGALATAILVVNNLRDIETDARAGKHTLAVRLGDGATRAYYLVLLAVAYLVPLADLVARPRRGVGHAALAVGAARAASSRPHAP